MASASRISALGAAHKPQAATAPANNAGATDDSSPFALLLNTVGAKSSARAGHAGKDDSGDTDNSQSDTASNAGPDTTSPADASAAAPASADTSILPQAPLLMLNLPALADDDTAPDEDAGDAPVKPAASGKSDDATQAAVPAPAPDMTAQLQMTMAMPVPVQPPVTQPASAPATDSGDDSDGVSDVAAAAPAGVPVSTPAIPAPPAQNNAPAKPAGPQASVPQATASQASAPQVQSAQPVTLPSPSAAQASDQDSADDDAAPPAKAAAPKLAAKTAAPGAAHDAGKIAKADTASNNTSNSQQDAAPVQAPPAPAPQPSLQAANTIAAAGAATAPAPASAPASGAVTQHIHVGPQESATPDVNALAVQIAAKSQSGARQFDIRLDPPELGRVDVRLSIDAGGKAQAHLTADQPSTLSMLQKDAPVLTRALRDAGLDVSQSGLNFSLRGQGGNQAQAQADGGQNGRRMPAMHLQAITSLEASATSAAWRGPADGRLDIRV